MALRDDTVIRQQPYRVEFERRRDPRWYPALIYVYVAIAPGYLIWRFTIINWDVWFGPATFVADLFGALTTALFLIVTVEICVPVYRPARLGPSVDALIPTLNEPLSILEPTIRGALRVRGIRNVLVLDDGNRPEIRDVAASLGATYITRTDNRFAKAGNMNNGLAHSDAEFVMTLDADHVPLPSFLERTLGYLDDPEVAFVQTPQSYYNRDSFLFRRTRKRVWSEQGMFYETIQVAKNRWNSAFYVGTSAVIRRSALNDVGGFATGTATEDVHTSLRLHARGWRSIFVPESLAWGLEADSLKEYFRQRRRWAAGSLGLMFRSKDSPLVAKGLTAPQRINYISATCAHLLGVQKLFYFLLPLLCIATLQSPVNAELLPILPPIIGFLLLSVWVTAAYSRGTYHPVHTEAYNLSHCLAHLAGVWGILRVQRKFSVSRKNANPAERTRLKAFFWALEASVVLAVTKAVVELRSPLPPETSRLVAICLVIVAANVIIFLSFVAALHLYEFRHQRRAELRQSVRLPVSPVASGTHVPQFGLAYES